jgi:hypothetical protein
VLLHWCCVWGVVVVVVVFCVGWSGMRPPESSECVPVASYDGLVVVADGDGMFVEGCDAFGIT